MTSRGPRHRRGLRALAGAGATLTLALALTPGSVAPAASAPSASARGAGTGGDVVLLGDSVTELAFGYLGGPTSDAPTHLRRWSHYGWTLRDAAEHAGAALGASSTGTLVIATGPNDAAPATGGWTSDDLARWRDIVADVPATTCVAFVLPGWGGRIDGTGWEAEMEAMRADVERLAEARRAAGAPTVVVDWLPVVTDHPGYLADDGIHLATKAAATARQSLYWHAVATCQSPTTS